MCRYLDIYLYISIYIYLFGWGGAVAGGISCPLYDASRHLHTKMTLRSNNLLLLWETRITGNCFSKQQSCFRRQKNILSRDWIRQHHTVHERQSSCSGKLCVSKHTAI